MGNLTFELVPSQTASGPQAIARIQAVNAEFRGAIKSLIEDAVAEGVRVARESAPRGEMFRHHGPTIADSIMAEPVRYHPGGAGGGGYYEASFSASSLIAPHLKFVFEGTGERGERPTGLIRPSQGNVMAIQKEGEGVHFRAWARGQFPQQRWWEDAEAHADEVLAAGVRSLGI